MSTSTPNSAKMELSDEERNWAKNIKTAIEAIPELDNLSDFWYAQLALIEHSNVEAAVERARGLQDFREEYGIVDNVAEGKALIKRLVKLFPRHFLAYSYNDRDDINILVMDMAAFDVSELSDPERVRAWIGGCYYMNQAMSEDLKGIRKGIHVFFECEGYTWHSGVELSMNQKIYTELLNHYPYKPNQIKHFHTGVIFNTVASMLKRFLTDDLRKAYQLGCQFDRRLDEIFLSPTVESSNQRLIDRLCACLQQRCTNESSFSL